MRVTLVGTGTNGMDSLTIGAKAAIENAEVLAGAKRMLAPYADSGKVLFCSYDPVKIAEYLEKSGAKSAAVLYSGDCGFFSGAAKLLPLLSGQDVCVLPGVSSVSALCAAGGYGYEQMRFISFHGVDANAAIHVYTSKYCFFLLGGEMTAAKLCARLCAYGLPDVRVVIGEKLGYDAEKIFRGKAADFIAHPVETLAVLITENPDALGAIPSAIPDEAFLRTKIPMTKAEVRCTAVSMLGIGAEDTCWDVGCGTGSVSVEMGFRAVRGRVFAFDRNPEAVRLTGENTRKFHADHIAVLGGDCPDILADAPAPDCVFIGGSGGKLPEIFDAIRQKNAGARIMVTAVTPEGLSQAVECFAQCGGEYRLTQIAVTRFRRVGKYTMPEALNPVYLVAGRLSCADL